MKTLIGVLTGYVLPLRWTVRMFLDMQLEENGVKASALPKGCRQEFAEDILFYARTLATTTRANMRAEIVDGAEIEATLIADVLQRKNVEGNDRIVGVLRKHGVAVPEKGKSPSSKVGRGGLFP